jgi:hemoglobin-like flavoprotein
MTGAAVERSFEIAAERAGDITPLVYQRLFALHPDMEALFVRDTTGAVRGEMLARLIDAMFDFLGSNHYATNFVGTEIVTHEGYGVPRDVFPKFIEATAATVQDICADAWTAEMETGWRDMTRGLIEPALAR